MALRIRAICRAHRDQAPAISAFGGQTRQVSIELGYAWQVPPTLGLKYRVKTTTALQFDIGVTAIVAVLLQRDHHVVHIQCLTEYSVDHQLAVMQTLFKRPSHCKARA